MPIRIVDGKEIVSNIVFYVNYYTGYTVYELPYHETYEVDYKLIYDSLKYEYFVCNNRSDIGYLFKGTADSSFRKLSKDSILFSRAYGRMDDFADVLKGMKTLHVKREETGRQTFVCRYAFDDATYDSAYMYYDRSLRGIPFSFSRTLDSAYNSKLVQMELFLRHPIDFMPGHIDFYKNRLLIEEVPTSNADTIDTFIKRMAAEERR